MKGQKLGTSMFFPQATPVRSNDSMSMSVYSCTKSCAFSPCIAASRFPGSHQFPPFLPINDPPLSIRTSRWRPF